MIRRGRVTCVVAVLVVALVPPSASGQSPHPSTDPVRLRPADTAQDDTFRLEIRVDGSEFVTDGPPVQVDTWLAYVGDEQRVTVSHAYGGIVAFGVRQLDGPFDPGGPARRMSRQVDEWTVGEARQVPFGKSGGFSADDPLADRYSAWFDDPMIHLGPGTYEITAQAEYGLDDHAATHRLEASVIVEVAPGPSERPFTAALVPRPLESPDLSQAWTPDGRPHAAVTRHGLRYELWLSTDELAPGGWLQVAVKATNTTERPICQFADGCGTYGSLLEASTNRRPAGKRWTGPAGEFKQRAMRVAEPPRRCGCSGPARRRHDRCQRGQDHGAGRVSRLRSSPAGAARPRRLTPGTLRGVCRCRRGPHAPIRRATHAGSVTITATWPFAGRGARPVWTDDDTFPAPIVVSAPVVLTGAGPTTLPLGQLVDTALGDPRFRARVDAHHDGTRWEVYVGRWPGPSYVNPRWGPSATVPPSA